MHKFNLRTVARSIVVAIFLIGPWAAGSRGKSNDADTQLVPPDQQVQRTGRPSFDMFLRRHDSNEDGKISKQEYRGPEPFFRRLDSDRDGVVDEKEFESRRRGLDRRFGQQQKNQRKLPVPDGVSAHQDIEYAKVADHSLRLDLYVPSNAKTYIPSNAKTVPSNSPSSSKHGKPPLLMWVHGGGWKNGDKAKMNPLFVRLTGEGFATASINYRLNGLTGHPEHIHDCKAAVRWLRANAQKYGYDATRIGVGGSSAGGHLVLLLGMTADVESLEGDVGRNLDQSSRVEAVLDLFGPSDFLTFSKGSSRFRSRNPLPVDQLRSASPLNYLTDDDAPVLIFQGDEDAIVPMSQSELLHQRYQAAGLESKLHVIEGAAHGGPKFSDSTRYGLAKAFFERHLKR